MIHIVTLSGNSRRFTEKNYPHKSLLDINGKSSFQEFIELIPDFNQYETHFICRDEDIKHTRIKEEIENLTHGTIHSIKPNHSGPLYSISNMIDEISDDQPLIITYIDSLQKTNLRDMASAFVDCDGGLNVHDLKHPHWRHNKYYCFVKHDEDNICTEVIEKFNFDAIDFNNCPGCSGSSGSYYFRNASVYKHYSDVILKTNNSINSEFYVTQIYGEMIKDNLIVKANYCPYGNLGTPEDYEDYIFWQNWFS
jgi:hypothetical protein